MRRIPELDGFRSLAVTLVMVDHIVYAWPLPEGALNWIPLPIRFLLSHGWLGVDLFFVLSGFLITGILLDEDRRGYFSRFYMRRATRILPLALVFIAICAAAYGRPYGQYFLLAIFFCANLAPLLSVPEPHGPVVLWSLSVEEHFYLIWPVLVLMLKRRTLAVVATTIVVGSPFLRAWAVSHGMNPETTVYELSWFRFDGLALGALLALWTRSVYFTPRHVWQAVGAWICVVAIATAVTMPNVLLPAPSPRRPCGRLRHRRCSRQQ